MKVGTLKALLHKFGDDVVVGVATQGVMADGEDFRMFDYFAEAMLDTSTGKVYAIEDAIVDASHTRVLALYPSPKEQQS